MEEYCKEKGFSGWFETSAKENVNIEDAAKFLVNKVLYTLHKSLHVHLFYYIYIELIWKYSGTSMFQWMKAYGRPSYISLKHIIIFENYIFRYSSMINCYTAVK